MTDKWYDKSIKQVEERLSTDLRYGLSREAALKRIGRRGGNVIYPVPRGQFTLYIRHILTDFTSILLLLTAVISAVLDKSLSAAVMIILLLANCAGMLFTYIKAQRVLEDMGQYALPTAKVMRGGRLYLVRQEQLAEGDVIYVTAGDIVPCDARLVESDGLHALEVTLTGVPKASAKDAEFIDYRDLSPADQKNMLFASTILTAGTGKAVVCAVGGDTLVCKMGKNAPLVSHEKLEIIGGLRKFCSVWSLCMIGLIFLLTALDILLGLGGRGLFESFLAGLSLAVSSMSELFTAFGYIVIACGVFNTIQRWKDINRGALIKNSSKLSALRDIDCLVVPKEGVFSTRQLRLEKIYANGVTLDVSERKFGDSGGRTLRYAVLSTGLYGRAKLIDNNTKNENIYSAEEDAIISAAERFSIYNVGLENECPLLDHEGTSEDNRFETTLFYEDGRFTAAVRGEISTLLARCDYYCENGKRYPMTHDRLAKITIAASLASKEAYRVVAVASGETVYNNLTRLNAVQSSLTFEGFLAIREPMLPGAAKNVSRLRAAGVRVIMTCDDCADNNRFLAEALGVAQDAAEVVTSAEMARMKPGLLRADIGKYTVFEGLTLAQKRTLLGWLREDGATVGLLARELDEIILLRECDVGFSQAVTLSVKAGREGVELSDYRIPIYTKSTKQTSRGGCEAVKFVSDVIIPEADRRGFGGFNAIAGAIASSKVIYHNIWRVLKYLITSQSAKLFIVLFGVLTGVTLFSPTQILFCGLAVDFAAVIIIAFERPGPDVFRSRLDSAELLAHPVINNLPSALFGLFWAVVTCSTPYLTRALDLYPGRTELLSAAFIGFILTQTVVLGESMKEKSAFIPNVRFNRVFSLTLVLTAAFIACCLLIPGFGQLFNVSEMPPEAWSAALLSPFVMLAVHEVYKLIVNHKSDKKQI